MSFLIVMQYTDEQIEKMLELKESIVDKMAKHQDELDFLQKNLQFTLKLIANHVSKLNYSQ